MTQTANLEILTHDAIPFRHGFFTRKGGASTGIYAGLNCGVGSSDHARFRVREQHRLTIGRQDRQHQPLGCRHQRVGLRTRIGQGAADGDHVGRMHLMHANQIGQVSIQRRGHPGAVGGHSLGVIGAAHAGWRGTRDGVLEATLEAMERLGARREDTVAVIGPTISQAAYEVGQEFIEAFIDDDREIARFFAGSANPGRAMFDLPGYALWRLRAAGVGQAEWTRHCTYRDEERFFSYRRTTHRGEADYGRLLSAIRL